VASLVLSAALHAVLYLPVSDLVADYLAPSASSDDPVRMVRLSPEAYRRSMQRARAARRDGAGRSAAARDATSKTQPVEKAEPEARETPESELDGQVVDVPPTRDDSPNPDAEYLGRHNANVEKERVARLEDRDPSLKRRTNELQRKAEASKPKSQKTLGLSVDGEEKSGGSGEGSSGPGRDRGSGEGKGEGRGQFQLEMPDLERRDDVQLELSDLPGVRQSVDNRTGTEAMKGNSDRFRYQPGDRDGRGADEGSSASGGGGGGSGGGLPSLDSLRPTLGTVARISGSPSSDYVEGVPEGDGTYLNTKEFKYATFFIRVKDSVEGYWRDITQREYRRRDPTGRVYGSRDRATLLSIVLEPTGELDSVSVARSCGLDFLDQAAVRAIREAQPFPNPPAGITGDDGSIRFNFQFVVVMRSAGPFAPFR